MCSMEAWQKHRNNTEVCEKDGKHFLKAHPEILYESYEEAHEVSERLRNLIVF